MTSKPQPLATLSRRMVEQGRIRLGVKKGGTGRPMSIDTFRFTSHDEVAIKELAAIYGGDAKPWQHGQWEVITQAKEIDVVLTAGDDAFSQAYEMWSGGGCQRRCDGEVAKMPQQAGPDDFEWVETNCICLASNDMQCKLKTRMTVLLPQIRFGGSWRLETSGMNAAVELPEQFDRVLALSGTGMTRAMLALEPRKSVANGKTKHFVVPTLRVAHSLDAMIEGAAQVRSLSNGGEAAPALEVGGGEAPASSEPMPPEPNGMPDHYEYTAGIVDDEAIANVTEILEAEVIEESVEEPSKADPRMTAAFMAILGEMSLDYERRVRPYLIDKFGASWSKMTIEQRDALFRSLTKGYGAHDKDTVRHQFSKKVRLYDAS